MSREDTQFSSENQPSKGRGKAFKTKLYEAMRAQSLLHTTPDMKPEEVEQVFIQHLALQAMKEDGDIYLLKDLMNKSFPPLKPTMDTFNFALSEDSSPSEKAQAILIATAKGDIPPDVGTMLIGAAKNALDIEAITELKERITALEKLYEQSS